MRYTSNNFKIQTRRKAKAKLCTHKIKNKVIQQASHKISWLLLMHSKLMISSHLLQILALINNLFNIYSWIDFKTKTLALNISTSKTKHSIPLSQWLEMSLFTINRIMKTKLANKPNGYLNNNLIMISINKLCWMILKTQLNFIKINQFSFINKISIKIKW